MFTATDILARLKQQPFVPLRIVTTAGEHEIRHPDLVLVGTRFLEIGTASRENPEVFDSINRVAILHITALEDIRDRPRGRRNGRGGG